jgi:PAS domain S-box-containing protein
LPEPGAVAPAIERAFRWTGEFVDPALEAAYARASWPETQARLRSVLIAVYIYVGWAVFDFLLIGFGWAFVALTAGRLATLAVLLVALKRYTTYDDHKQFMRCALSTQILVAIVAPVSLVLGQADFAASLLAVVVVLFAFYISMPTALPSTLTNALALSIAFVAICPWLADVSPAALGQIAALVAVVNAIGVEMVRAANRLRRSGFLTLMRQQELYDQLKREVEVRREAEQAVRATEESFQSLFYAAPLPISLVDPIDYRLVQANIAALKLFDISEDEAEGFDVRALFSEEDLGARLDRLLVSGRAGVPVEFRLKRRDGTLIWALVSAATVQFHGRPALLIGIQDVTARHKEAETLREARDQATAASRSKSEFLANMSHELRTPLNAIIGFSEALERELFGPVGNPRYREYAEDIHNSGVHLLSLINDILDLSKIEAGQFVLHEDETELDHMVEAATRIVRHRAQQANIAIECNLPKPSIFLVADERALKQVLINLVSNAVKFSPDGSAVKIEAQVCAESLRIAVIDKGIGIAEQDIPRALTPFTQVDGSLSRAHEGTGLGLPLAKHLTELHDGTLTIQSEPDVGTTVYVDLPLSRVVGRDASPKESAAI